MHPTLSPRETRALLDQLGHRPSKRLGQNFLIDGNIVRKSLAFAEVRSGDHVVEIGPGLGTLTGALVHSGALVDAVELDPTLAAHIRATFPDSAVRLCEGDAVAKPIGRLAGEAIVPSFKVVANLPYAITSPWVDALLAGPLPTRMVLMMQKEAADRLTAPPGTGDFGAISIFLQSAYTTEGRHPVARTCFHPVPGVDSVLLVLARRPHPLRFAPQTRAAIRRLFTQRRKQIAALVRHDPLLGPWWSATAANHSLSPTLRAEAVPLAAWQRLAQTF